MLDLFSHFEMLLLIVEQSIKMQKIPIFKSHKYFFVSNLQNISFPF